MLPLETALLSQFPATRWSQTRILLAVSGGADSVALLRAICRINERSGDGRDPHNLLSVAHFNHGWRGAESDGDEQFVRQLCDSLSISVHVGRDRCQPPEMPRSEASAREQRYAFLTNTAYRLGARYVLTAHTASDRVETLLHNLYRGTGLAGVSVPGAIRHLHQELVLVRPLIGCSRADVEQYLESLHQSFRTDSSNANQAYRRNFLRHTLLPMVRQVYGSQVDQRLTAFSEDVAEIVQLHHTYAADYLQRVEELWNSDRENHRGTEPAAAFDDLRRLHVPKQSQADTAWPIVFNALQTSWQRRQWPLQDMRREHWQQLRRLWSQALPTTSSAMSNRAASERVVHAQLPGDLHVSERAEWLLIERGR